MLVIIIYTVYEHINKTNNKKYIGITSNQVEIRWKKGKGYSEHLPIGRAFNKYGWDGFEHIILYENLSEDEAKEIEIKLIKELNTQDSRYGYNLCDGGEGVSGWKHTDEAKRIMSEKASKRTGDKNPNYGNYWSDEQKRIASEKKKENMSDETRKKLSKSAKERVGIKNPFFGKHHNKETKEKLSSYRKRKVRQYNIDGSFIKEHDSIRDAGESVGVNPVAISNCCRGMSKTSAGFMWRYSDKCED